MKQSIRHLALVLLLVPGLSGATGQQVVDSAFQPRVRFPTYAAGAGPVVLLDVAHHNQYALDGGYQPLAALLRADGYRVEALRAPFTPEALAGGQIVVIINALATEDVDHWILPTPAAFAPNEEEALYAWVAGGGALLLAADHMPFPGAANRLARRLGLAFSNGFAIDTATWDPLVFGRGDGRLATHAITEGRNAAERIDSVATFWGQGFLALDARAVPLLTFGVGVISYYPDTAWQFNDGTPTRAMQGWLQGATLTVGAGRVVVLGEAGMVSAFVTGPQRLPMGMNAPVASGNQQFVLNVFHWLSGLLPLRE